MKFFLILNLFFILGFSLFDILDHFSKFWTARGSRCDPFRETNPKINEKKKSGFITTDCKKKIFEIWKRFGFIVWFRTRIAVPALSTELQFFCSLWLKFLICETGISVSILFSGYTEDVITT